MYRIVPATVVVYLLAIGSPAADEPDHSGRPVSTYSIVARDAATGTRP